jgi:NADPH-dependent curcumin reductase CurA
MNGRKQPNRRGIVTVVAGAVGALGMAAAMSVASAAPAGAVATAAGDGSVRFIRNSIDIDLWRASGTVSGGEVVGVD